MDILYFRFKFAAMFPQTMEVIHKSDPPVGFHPKYVLNNDDDRNKNDNDINKNDNANKNGEDNNKNDDTR